MTNQHFVPDSANKISSVIYKTAIDGLLYIDHEPYKDHRGFYAELSRIPEIEQEVGQAFVIKQLNLSHSVEKVIRGIHAENWNKLLTIIDGICFCAWVDLRPHSATFGQTVTMTVGEGPDALFGSVFVSQGIGNSFCVTQGPANYLYAVDALYAERDKSGDQAISLFDPDLAINWPLSRDEMIISERDQQAITMRQAFPDHYKPHPTPT